MLPHIHKQALRANRAHNIVYLNNPKVGCSTVKNALWNVLAPESAGPHIDVHRIEGSPFQDNLIEFDWLETAQVFTFVRNPFVRVVSAYLNKIAGQEPVQWEWFVRRYNVPEDETLPFDDFVRLISEDTPEGLDPHWRPQYINLMYPFVQPNYIGKLERMDIELPEAIHRYIGTPPTPIKRKSQHSTNSQSSYLGFFSNPETLRRVIDLYYNDFQYFGYSLDLSAPVEGMGVFEAQEHSHYRLAALADFRRAGTSKEKQEVLDRIEEAIIEDPLARHDSMCQDWLIFARLEAGAGSPADSVRLIRERINQILAGPEYLRRAAGRVAAGQGAWFLCNQIAARSLR